MSKEIKLKIIQAGRKAVHQLIKVAEEKIQYLKNQNLKQGKIKFE